MDPIFNSQLVRDGFVIDGSYFVYPSRNELQCVSKDRTQPTRNLILEPRIVRLLVWFASNPEKTLSRELLLREIWEGHFVSDEALTQAISRLRAAFGESANNSKMIQTVSKIGYRLIAKVEPLSPSIIADADDWNLSSFIKGPKLVKFAIIFAAVIVCLTILLVSTPLFKRSKKLVDDEHSVMSFSSVNKLTFENSGIVMEPTISPDGEKLAYVQYDDSKKFANSTLKLKSLASKSDIVLVSDTGLISSLYWSPDQKAIAFCRSVPGRNELQIASLNEDGFRTLLTCPEVSPVKLAWAPSGETIVYCERHSKESAYQVYTIDVTSGDKTAVTFPPTNSYGDITPKVSPNGRQLAFIRATERQFWGYIMLLKLDEPGAIPHKLGRMTRGIGGIEWVDDSNIAFIAKKGATTGIWNISTESGEEKYLGGHNITSFSICHKTKKVFYSSDPRDVELLKRPLSTSAQMSDSGIAILDTAIIWSSPDIAPDGNRVAYISKKSGSPELWVSDSDGSNRYQLTFFNDKSIYNPVWSPNGRMIAFEERDFSNSGIYYVSSTGGDPVLIIQDEFVNLFPTWSIDGRDIYFCSNRSGQMELWKTSLDGTNQKKVIEGRGLNCAESFDGQFLYYTLFDTCGLWRISTSQKVEELVKSTGGYGVSKINLLSSNELCYLEISKSGTFSIDCLNLETKISSTKIDLGSVEKGFHPLFDIDKNSNWACITRLLPVKSEVFEANL